MSSLLDLPPELVLEIHSYLTDHDALVLRMVNKSLERICFDVFARKHFRKRGFMITTESIHTLTQIAHHAGIRKHVHHLWFNPDCFTGVDCSCEPRSRSTKCCLMAAYKADHYDLLRTRSLETRLRAVLGHLPRLKTIGMRRSAAYKPYGWRAMADRTGKDPRELGPDLLHRVPSVPLDTTCLFMAFLNALHGTDVHLERLYTDLVELEHPALHWPSTEELRSALSRVKYFELNVIGMPANAESDEIVPAPTTSGGRLETVLKAMSGLHELALTIFKSYRLHLARLPTTPYRTGWWRRTYPFLVSKRLADTCSLHNLLRVKLDKIIATVPVLVGILQHSSAVLMSIKLSELQLLPEDGNDSHAWDSFFGFLLEHCQSLVYLLLTRIWARGKVIDFLQCDHDDKNCVRHREELNLKAQESLGQDFDLEIVGKEEIRKRLRTLRTYTGHYRHELRFRSIHTGWHTDTSDEDW